MLRWLRDLFASSPAPAARPIGPPPRGFTPPSSFSYAEDDHCQREFFPPANADFLARQALLVEEHRVATYAPTGFRSIYQRPGPPFPLAALGMPVEELAAALGGLGATRFARVMVRSGPERLLIPEACAFGGDTYAVVCAAQAGIVQMLWLQVGALPAAGRPVLAALLTALGRRYGLLLMDWEDSRLVKLADAAAVAQYVAG